MAGQIDPQVTAQMQTRLLNETTVETRIVNIENRIIEFTNKMTNTLETIGANDTNVKS